MDSAVFDALKAKVIANKQTADKAAEMGGFWVRRVQSDKVGFDWNEDWLGEKLIRQTYVEQAQPMGTADFPIALVEGVPLIANAYYTYEGKRYVWMGAADVCESIKTTLASEEFVEF